MQPTTNALALISEERTRQIYGEGFTDHNDDGYMKGELVQGAICYADVALVQQRKPDAAIPPCFTHKSWPWQKLWFKPRQGLIRNLVKAGALIAAALDQVLRSEGRYKERPKIVCLCGSTRFWKHFQKYSLIETMEGNIVLSIGAATASDDEHFGSLPKDEYDYVKTKLDDLHLRKVEMADEVLVLNVGGYIGDSTRREVQHAFNLGKPVRWMHARMCRACSCTEYDCSQCIEKTGHPCSWVEPDLCSACK